ncbi:MAG: serine/threonine-protein kinase [Myxococcota bacterium]
MTTPTTRPARPTADSAPRHIGRYELVGRLGAGGMGIVYIARDPQLDRKVALKVLRPNQSGDTKARARVAREAKAMARVSHRNVVGVYDAGVFEDEDGESRVFIAMELVEGQDLRDWIRTLRDTERWKAGEATGEILDRFLEAGEGLATAHDAGLVHRDFKPANVLVDEEGRARVGDFGLARPLEERDAQAMTVHLENDALPLEVTRTEDMVGTPGYMAPELFRPAPADALSDQYAFCVSLYEALYGERPVWAETFPALVLATLQGVIREAPAAPPVSPRLRSIVLRGLSTSPGDRWPDLRALLDALRRERARPARQRRLAVVSGVTLAVVGTAFAAGTLLNLDAVDCDSTSDALSGVWDSERRSGIENAMLGVDVPFAGRTWSATAAHLDEYASDLEHAYRTACEATHVQGTQSEAMLDRTAACLDRRRLALRVLGDELAQPDASVVENAAAAAQSLPSLVACEGAIDVPTPPAEAAEEVDDVRSAVESARAKVRAGRIDAATSTAEDARTRAESIGWPPLVAEASLVHGEALHARGDFEGAARALRAAALGSIEEGDADLVVEAATRLIDVAGVRGSEPAAGDVWADLATATLARIGRRPMAEAALASERARLASAEGRRDEALTEARRAIELVERHRGPRSLALATPLAQLGDILAKLRDFHGAIEPLQRLNDLLDAELDPSHPDRIAAQVRLAGAWAGAGRREDARTLIDEARALAVESLPADHPVRARALMKRGDILAITGHPDEAIPEYEQALVAVRAAYGEEHTEVARGLLNMAGSQARLGRIDEAIALWRQALALRERLLGENHPDLAIVLQNIGSVEVERGRVSEGLVLLARAHRIRYETPAATQARADIDYWYGRALYESGDRDRGRPMVEAALQASVEGGYENPASNMRDWLATHP